MIYQDKYVYDETSPSCLRFKHDSYFGKGDSIMRVKAGDAVGFFCQYLKYYICGKHKRCHRIVWEMHNGPIPKGMVIDHINRDTTDNRISNLRCVSGKVNSRNAKKYSTNKSGTTGVFLVKGNVRGVEIISWRAMWVDEYGKSRTKSFAISKYGYERAKAMAISVREAEIEQMNKNGAGYSEAHGTEL